MPHGWSRCCSRRSPACSFFPNNLKGHGHEPSRFARAFHTLLDRLLRMKYAVIAATAGLFVAALLGMQLVQQQFFPSSDRPELLVDVTLATRVFHQCDAQSGR